MAESSNIWSHKAKSSIDKWRDGQIFSIQEAVLSRGYLKFGKYSPKTLAAFMQAFQVAYDFCRGDLVKTSKKWKKELEPKPKKGKKKDPSLMDQWDYLLNSTEVNPDTAMDLFDKFMAAVHIAGITNTSYKVINPESAMREGL